MTVLAEVEEEEVDVLGCNGAKDRRVGAFVVGAIERGGGAAGGGGRRAPPAGVAPGGCL